MNRRDLLKRMGMAIAASGLAIPEWLINPPKGRSMIAVPEFDGTIFEYVSSDTLRSDVEDVWQKIFAHAKKQNHNVRGILGMTPQSADMWFWTVLIGAAWVIIGLAFSFAWGAFARAFEEDDE